MLLPGLAGKTLQNQSAPILRTDSYNQEVLTKFNPWVSQSR